jgi:hypothetical protein
MLTRLCSDVKAAPVIYWSCKRCTSFYLPFAASVICISSSVGGVRRKEERWQAVGGTTTNSSQIWETINVCKARTRARLGARWQGK